MKKWIYVRIPNPKILRNRIVKLEKELKLKNQEIKKMKNPRCPKCGSWEVIRRGTRKVKRDKTNIQRFCCLNCNWKFTQESLDFRMRHNKKIIYKALRLRKQGKTYSQIAEELGSITSRVTIMRWLHKFQLPKKEKVIERDMSNQYGSYKRKFKIKV